MNMNSVNREQPVSVLPLAEAATYFGLTKDALRMRLRRGRAAGYRVGSHWYVATSEAIAANSEQPPRSRSRTLNTNGEQPPEQGLVAQLQSEVTFLRTTVSALTHQLEQAAVERAELRRLLAGEQQRRLAPPVEIVATQAETAGNRPQDAVEVLSTAAGRWWAFWRR
jgi:hypothetical protein